MRRLAILTAIAVLFVAAAAMPAAAHARLIATDPSGGATVEEAPRRVQLTFSERIESTFAGVQVFGPDRKRVDEGQPRVAGERVNVPLQRLLREGRYTVVFRIISGDGHPVRSQFAFTLKAQPAGTPTPTPSPAEVAPSETATQGPPVVATDPSETPSGTAAPSADDEVFELEDAGAGTTTGLWLSRFINYTSLTAVIGLLVAVLHLLRGGADGERRRRTLLKATAVAAGVWALSALVLFVFGLSSASARALPEALRGDLLGQFRATRFGATALLQAALAATVAGIALVGKSQRAAIAAAAVAVVAAAAPAWWGHAGTDELPAVALLCDWGHILAAAAWVGGLAVLAGILLRGSRSDGEAVRAATRFSTLAGYALVVVVGTGSISALLHLGALENLYGTTWGRLVVAKLVIVGVIAYMGWRNRTRLLPKMTSTDAGQQRSAFRKMAAAEVAVMLVAFGLATGLASGIPADAEAASRIQSIAGVFGDGQINITVDPAAVGPNLIHVYFLDENGRQREVAEPSLSFARAGGVDDAKLFASGPGHYTILAHRFASPGSYEMRVAAFVAGERVETTTTVTVR